MRTPLRPLAAAVAVGLATSGCSTHAAAGTHTPPGMQLRMRFTAPREVRVVSPRGSEAMVSGVVRAEGQVLRARGDTPTLDISGSRWGLWGADGELTGPGMPWTMAVLVRSEDDLVERREFRLGRTLLFTAVVVFVAAAAATAVVLVGLASDPS